MPGALEHRTPDTTPRNTLVHEVAIAKNSTLAQILGTTDIMTNSIHHQGVDRLGAGLTAVGWTKDGLIEALEDPTYPFLVGVQWHPEELTGSDALWKKLFSSFIEASKNRLE
jgi:putative glutamine amidotransferase